MKKLLNILVFVLCLHAAFAQQILSLSIIPANPQVNDSVRVIADCMFGSGGCALDHVTKTNGTGSIDVNLFHCVGMLTYICNSVDTIQLGQLPAGNYSLTTNLFYSEYISGECNSFSQANTSILSFQVISGTGISGPQKSFIHFQNNGRKIFVDNPEAVGMHFSLIDLNGKICFDKIIDNQMEIDVSEITSGLYIYSLRSRLTNVYEKILIGE